VDSLSNPCCSSLTYTEKLIESAAGGGQGASRGQLQQLQDSMQALKDDDGVIGLIALRSSCFGVDQTLEETLAVRPMLML